MKKRVTAYITPDEHVALTRRSRAHRRPAVEEAGILIAAAMQAFPTDVLPKTKTKPEPQPQPPALK